jgi:hypothetical protein
MAAQFAAACASIAARKRFLPKNWPWLFCASVTPSL